MFSLDKDAFQAIIALERIKSGDKISTETLLDASREKLKFCSSGNELRLLVPSDKAQCEIIDLESASSDDDDVPLETDNIGGGRPFTLYDKADEERLNDAHNLIRRDVLEGFVLNQEEGSSDDDKGSKKEREVYRRARARSMRYRGSVGFRCKYCKTRRACERARMSAIYPRSLKGIYRAYIRFMSTHFESCQFVPQEIKDKHLVFKNRIDSRGDKKYWVASAVRKGLRDVGVRGGITLVEE